MASRSSSKSKSHWTELLPTSNSRRWQSGENRVLSAASWKALVKQSPWLKQLRPHQVLGLKAALSTDGFAALFAQRTGKTWVTGAVLEAERSVSRDVLLIGPLTNLESTWLKFISEKLAHYTVHRDLDSYLAHRKKAPDDHCILLLNYEAVTPILKKLRRRRWDRCIIDEAQRLKNRSSRSSRDVGLLAGSCKRRLALTGTPMDLDCKDLWAIMRFVNPDVFGTVWKDFAKEFLVEPHLDLKKKGMIAKQREMLRYQIAKRKAPMREDMIPVFAEECSPYVMRISKEDAGIEPAKVHVVKFNLDPQEEKLYRQLEKKMIVRVKGRAIKTPLKVVQIGKLQQITGGHIKDEEGEVHRIGTTKRRRLRKLIKDYVDHEPFVVFCKYTHEVHMIARMIERMGYNRVGRLWGKVKDGKLDKKRTNLLLAFQRGEYDAIVCQQRTGGVGVDLYKARKFFVYSMGHSFIDYDQMVSRGDFLEQNEPADFFILAVRWSIDTDIVVCHKKKRSISEQFYGRLQRH